MPGFFFLFFLREEAESNIFSDHQMIMTTSSNVLLICKETCYRYGKFNYLMLIFCDLVMKDLLTCCGAICLN